MPFINQHQLYSVYKGMKQRCYSVKHKHYKNYGARGITVCDKWLHDYKSFIEDMGDRPLGYTLERIDNNKGYSPENCRWASRKEQQLNTRVVNRFTVDGVEIIVSVLAKQLGMKTDTILNRIKKGLPYEEIISPERKINLSGLKLGGEASGVKKRALTHCKNGHEFTEKNTLITKQGWRKCRVCAAIRENDRRNAEKILGD